MDPATIIIVLGGLIWAGVASLPIFAILLTSFQRTPEEQAQADIEQLADLRKSRTERMLGL